MTLHIVKLSVGSESLADLIAWQKQRMMQLRAMGQRPELVHVTRMTPKRAAEVLDGGSIYWVIKGYIVGRQKLIELRPLQREGVSYCGFVCDSKMIAVRMQPRRAFQGWRYLTPEDAPPDRASGDQSDEMPETMRRELAALGLL